tara:strand:+ start:107 stop:481 length:375 start_codon:yes stop_codon:yes gene_type:complete
MCDNYFKTEEFKQIIKEVKLLKSYKIRIVFNGKVNSYNISLEQIGNFRRGGRVSNNKIYRYYKYNLLNVKKYNSTNATNKNIHKENLLSKNDLLLWCEINNIKCKKNLKYCDIIKLLMNSMNIV